MHERESERGSSSGASVSVWASAKKHGRTTLAHEAGHLICPEQNLLSDCSRSLFGFATY